MTDGDLDTAGEIVHTLYVQARSPLATSSVDEAKRRRRTASELMHRFALPMAVYEGPTHRPAIASDAWTRLLGAAHLGPADLSAVLESGTSARIAERTFVLLGGREVHCRVALQPLHGDLGDVEGVIAVCADITDATIARRLGAEPEALVWSGPLDAMTDYHNARWSSATGGGTGPWQTSLHGDDLDRTMRAFSEAVRNRISSTIEARIRSANGEYGWHRVQFSMSPALDRWYGVATNIHVVRQAETERAELVELERAARDDAEQANRLKDQFLASVSHELRAPLTTMSLWIRVLRDASSSAALRTQAVAAIDESAQAQSRLVADLLDVARAISGKLFVDLRPVSLAGIVRAAVADVRASAAREHVEIVVHIDDTVGKVDGDAHRIRQIVDNLLSNAVKFSDAGSAIDVTVRRNRRMVILDVMDHGRGIAPEFMARLFQPFSQTDDALTRSHAGLGLGLSIAHQLVMLHHGTLTAASRGHGHGATFTLSIPAASHRVPSPAPGSALAAPVLDGIRVLIVDDDWRVRDALVILLARAGAAVDTAGSATAARAQIEANTPDAVLCDIAMPGEDGYSFVRQLRTAAAPGGTVPAIALTAHASASDGHRALGAGFNLHLPKPIDVERLVASVYELVAARRSAMR